MTPSDFETKARELLLKFAEVVLPKESPDTQKLLVELADTVTDVIASLTALFDAGVKGARRDERAIAEHELRDEYRKVQEAKALTPDGINGYWCAIRDLSLNSSDRLAELSAQSEERQE